MMKQNKPILLSEILSLFECQVLLKTESSYNKVDLFNQIRAVSGIVVVNVVHSDFLEKKRTSQYEYSLIKIKYIVNKSPREDIKILGGKVIKGDGQSVKGGIDGVLQFLPRYQTIRKVSSKDCKPVPVPA